MYDKPHKMVDGLFKKACKSQGGSFRNQGPNSVGGQGSIKGEAVSSPHTSHDNAMHKQGGKKRSTKSIH